MSVQPAKTLAMTLGKEILQALDLGENVKSFTLEVAANAPVTVTLQKYATAAQANEVARILTEKYYLVAKSNKADTSDKVDDILMSLADMYEKPAKEQLWTETN